MYVAIWEFRLRHGTAPEFERAYGPGGAWTALFKKGSGYLRTELLRNTDDPDRYLTIDYWTSRGAYELFRQEYADEYRIVDLACETFTAQEAHIGSFTTL